MVDRFIFGHLELMIRAISLDVKSGGIDVTLQKQAWELDQRQAFIMTPPIISEADEPSWLLSYGGMLACWNESRRHRTCSQIVFHLFAR